MKKILSTLLVMFVLFLVCSTASVAEYTPEREIVGLRDQYSKTAVDGDGNFTTTTFLGSIHYETVDGGFYPIQTDILPSSKPDWDWEVETGHWQLYVKNDATVVVGKGNNRVGHRLHGIAYYDTSAKQYKIIQTTEAVIPTVNGNTILWRDIIYGADYRLSYTNDSLKEDVIIKQALRDFLNSTGNTPSDYGLNPSTTHIAPIFEMDWSQSLPIKLKDGVSVNRSNSEHEQDIYFGSPTKDKYFDTNLVSYMPVDYATSVNPVNPEASESKQKYDSAKIRKRLITDGDGDWLLAGIKFNALNKMPEGSVVFDPTETLRPDGTGDQEDISNEVPGGQPHWSLVDESSPDEDSTYIYGASTFWARDLYNVPDHSVGTGEIHSITVTARARITSSNYWNLKIGIKSGTGAGAPNTVSETLKYVVSAPDWRNYTETWTTNPATASAWTWDEIDKLQIGVSLLYLESGYVVTHVTQVYVSVSYTPPTLSTVTTQAATNTDNVSTVGNGNITSTYENCDYRGFVWDTSSHEDPGNVAPPATYSDNVTVSGSFGTGAFSYSIADLAPSTTYYYRAHAHNTMGWSYGNEQFFVTDDVPTVTVDAASNVAYTSARLNSTLTTDGGVTCEVRFQYFEVGGGWTDNATTWVDGYTIGQHPYVDVSSLTFNALYYFRAQARNVYGTVNSGNLTFTTLNAVLEPSNFKAFPETTSVALSWTKGFGSTSTLVVYKEGAYPATTSDGLQAYFGTSSSYTHTSLTSGHTYYYSTWGHSGTTYSDNYTTVMATTLAVSGAGEAPDAPTMPSTWFQTPNYTQFSGVPLYNEINAFFDAFEMPRASGWFFSAISGCIVFGFLVFGLSKHPIPALIAEAVSFAIVSLVGLVPMWMMAFTVIFMLGAIQLGRAR